MNRNPRNKQSHQEETKRAEQPVNDNPHGGSIAQPSISRKRAWERLRLRTKVILLSSATLVDGSFALIELLRHLECAIKILCRLNLRVFHQKKNRFRPHPSSVIETFSIYDHRLAPKPLLSYSEGFAENVLVKSFCCTDHEAWSKMFPLEPQSLCCQLLLRVVQCQVWVVFGIANPATVASGNHLRLFFVYPSAKGIQSTSEPPKSLF